MGRLFSRRKYRDLILGLALLCAVLALMRWPQESMAAARDGLALCGNVIIPSLFPFFVLSSLVVELGMSRYLGRLLEGVMAPLFRVGGACSSALALGFVGGYPVGARTAIALYENGQCSKTCLLYTSRAEDERPGCDLHPQRPRQLPGRLLQL